MADGAEWSLSTLLLGSAVAAAAVLGACGKLTDGQSSHHRVRSSDCITCHQRDFESATQPPHVGVVPHACGTCHTNEAWSPAQFHHPWPLVGAHAKGACSGCHSGNPPVYAGTPKLCVGCHQRDYDSSPYPGHQAFSTTCNDCHSTLAWKPASPVAHPFPLEGAHAAAPCNACHGDPPTYAGTPRDCVGCHRDDYDRSTYPGHPSFATTCADCHTTTAWKPATGGGHPENAFPITREPHRMPCGDCHNAALGPNGRDNVDCVGCHTGEHSRTRMDEKHREQSGYPRAAAAPHFCVDCHPSGRN